MKIARIPGSRHRRKAIRIVSRVDPSADALSDGQSQHEVRELPVGPARDFADVFGQDVYERIESMAKLNATTGVSLPPSIRDLFPALSDLILDGLLLQSTIVPPHVPEEGHPLTHVELRDNYDVITAVSQWLSQAQVVRDLKSLKWWPDGVDMAEESWKTLSEAINGHTLQELHFYVSPSWIGQCSFCSYGSVHS